MKKLFMLSSLLALTFAFQSCETDDSEALIVSPLIGFWSITEYTVTQSIDLNNDGTLSNDVLIELPCYNQVYNFMANGDFNSTSNSILIVSTSDEQGNETTEGFCDNTEILNGFWDLENNTLTLTVNEMSFSQTIEVTDTILSITNTSDFGEETLVFAKQ